MLTALKNFFRNRCLKKHANGLETGIIPVSSVRSAAVLINAHSEDFRQAETEVKEYFRQKKISAEIIYLDTSRNKKGMSAISSPESTIYSKDLNWYGKPSKVKCGALLSSNKDIFIELTRSDEFAAMFISTAHPAKFKIGCCSSSVSDPFNIVVAPSKDADAGAVEIFKHIAAILESIR